MQRSEKIFCKNLFLPRKVPLPPADTRERGRLHDETRECLRRRLGLTDRELASSGDEFPVAGVKDGKSHNFRFRFLR